MFSIKKEDYNIENVVSYGNMFLIGNGHLGYRGTLEEYDASSLVSLNIVGFYDKYKDKWRESLNAPNPFYLRIKDHSVFDKPLKHQITLDLKHAIFKRKTVFKDLIISSSRFISSIKNNELYLKFDIIALENKTINFDVGLDTNVYEINGPHYKEKKIQIKNTNVYFEGITNENKYLKMISKYILPQNVKINVLENKMFNVTLNIQKGKTYSIYIQAKLFENEDFTDSNFSKNIYLKSRKQHNINFENKWKISDIKIKGDSKAQLGIRYSIYHLLILGNENYQTSIPARGVSGQTYKGAIFWDSEIFLEPFFSLNNPKISKNILLYRVNTLNGAKSKAKEFNYDGAFYAWESQDTGLEACSKYNVSDPITHEPIRTYFNEKQIHISADIVYSFNQYINLTGDESILLLGGLDVLKEVCKFYISYATKVNNKYHLLDVIGPDEYHERIDDNAFTNYMVYNAFTITLKYLKKYESKSPLITKFKNFRKDLFLPKVHKNGLIEQFSSYFKLEDVSVDEVRSRIKVKNEYWGGKNGVATKTRVIKQADVITLIALLNNRFNDMIRKANYDFYFPYTEHGSSLSSSMYSIVGFKIGEIDSAYKMFLKSSLIDLGTNQKLYAGGIYIGGTHPASSGGAYMSLIYGMLGIKFKKKISLTINMPRRIKEIDLNFIYRKHLYHLIAKNDKTYILTKEQKYD